MKIIIRIRKIQIKTKKLEIKNGIKIYNDYK